MRQIHHWSALLFVAAIVVHLGPGVLHRRLPPAARDQLDRRRHAADPGHLQRLRRLLAARRPAVGHRPAHRLLDHAVGPARRHVAGLAAVRRRVPRSRHHHPALRHPHPASCRPSSPCCSTVHLALVVRHKHTQFPGPGPREDNVVGERMWPTYASKAVGLFFLTAAVLCLLGGAGPDQPDLDLRAVRPRRGVARRRSPTGTWAGSTARCGSCPGGRSGPSASRSPTRSSRACCWPGHVRAAVRLAVPRGPASPATTPSTTSATGPGSDRCAPRSAWPRSPSTACCFLGGASDVLVGHVRRVGERRAVDRSGSCSSCCRRRVAAPSPTSCARSCQLATASPRVEGQHARDPRRLFGRHQPPSDADVTPAD